MNKKQYLRINFEVEDNLSVDDIEAMPLLMDRGEKDFYKYQTEIADLLGVSNRVGNNHKRSKKGFKFT